MHASLYATRRQHPCHRPHGAYARLTYHRPFSVHPKVELIFVPVGGLLPQALDPVLFRVVVPSTKYIVLVFFKDTKAFTVRELGTLFMIPAMEGVAQ